MRDGGALGSGGGRCFEAIMGRVVGEPTMPSSWPTGSSASLMAGHHPNPKCASSGRYQLFAHSQDTNHHNRTRQKIPGRTQKQD